MHLSLKSLFEIIAVIIFAAVVVKTGIAIVADVVSTVVVNLVIVFVVFILAVNVLILVILDTSHLKTKK